MIHRQGQQPPSPRLRPVGGQMQQGYGVPPARQGDSDRFRPARLQPRVQPREDAAGQPLGVVWAQLQFARVRSCVARVFCAAVAVSA
ncbi:hypothetical protein HNP51_002024 [Brevundimonas bullata]|nr:hypothetical protein [Brevundimonas bullata]